MPDSILNDTLFRFTNSALCLASIIGNDQTMNCDKSTFMRIARCIIVYYVRFVKETKTKST